ncbi:MAG: hypothetical protein KF696_00765 [Planctomycetes bacterium]|nr:hypothetical protein [Planctomycetota bacterium]MCW8134530.1 hypothetical protein [Planctomycetota bacterium]
MSDVPPNRHPALRALKAAKRWIGGPIIALFILAHTGAIVLSGIDNMLEGDPFGDFSDYARNLMTALGTHQRWNMFSPNVGNWSSCPVVLVEFKDGRKELLQSPATPPLHDVSVADQLDSKLPPERRAMQWITHIGDGRRRKLDSRAADTGAGYAAQRTVYARWTLEHYLRDHPHERDNVLRIDLFRSRVRHVGDGLLPQFDGMDYLFIYPELDAKWPKGVGTSFARPGP